MITRGPTETTGGRNNGATHRSKGPMRERRLGETTVSPVWEPIDSEALGDVQTESCSCRLEMWV